MTLQDRIVAAEKKLAATKQATETYAARRQANYFGKKTGDG